MKKMISLGHEKDGLYIMVSNPPVAIFATKRDISHSTLDELFTWNCRVDHLSFLY